MRRLLAVGIIALGCAQWAMPLAAQKSSDVGVRLEYSRADEPLLYLNQPAYVALFELVPGRGVVQLYPLTSYEASYLVEPGYRQIIPARADMARRLSWQAGVAVRQFIPGFHLGAPVVTQVAARPQGFVQTRHVVAIASNQPLNVGRPNETISRLHLAMPSLWTPAAFEASPTDLESLIEAIVPAGAASGVSALQVASPIYTMVTYSPRAWAEISDPSKLYAGAEDDEVWASCLGMRIRVPSWYIADAVCAEPVARPGQQAALTNAGVPAVGLVPVAAPSTGTRIADLPVREVRVLTPVERLGPNEVARHAAASDMGAGEGRDVPAGSSKTDARAGAPGTLSTPSGASAPRPSEGAGPPPAPARAPTTTARPSGASRERPVP